MPTGLFDPIHASRKPASLAASITVLISPVCLKERHGVQYMLALRGQIIGRLAVAGQVYRLFNCGNLGRAELFAVLKRVFSARFHAEYVFVLQRKCDDLSGLSRRLLRA